MEKMEQFKQEFIEFLVRCGVLTFGDFTTKSGRKTPFFINTGKFDQGEQVSYLGWYYAKAIMEIFPSESFNVVFGAAYKGIPLVTTTAIQLAANFQKNCYYCFNRKEAKDHGEGGELIGHKPVKGDRIILIDDVITAGTSTRESIELFSKISPEAEIIGGIISVDRMERGADSSKSAIGEIKEKFNLDIKAIVTLDEIILHLHNKEVESRIVIDDEMLKKITAYREKYGAEY
jgi:orotate phosphoribosyltransferase